MGGYTYDSSITGISTLNNFPYIALQSISAGGKSYWEKAFSSKFDQAIGGVQFSADGMFLIAHSLYSISTFIVLFNVSSGSILSTRSYSTGGQNNYKYQVKSMLVSSGASPMAYVLSNYNVGDSCTGQQLFKFEPLKFSSAAVWIKQTIGSSSNNCKHQGLVFGRTELFLYAFSWYNELSTVSLLDSYSNSIWQYSTPDGHQYYRNSIKYLQIDGSRDMVIATSGSTYINYNRIISSSTSPSYSVSSSQTFRDPTPNTTRQLYGLYIKDQNNAVSLMYDTSTQMTDLATINFTAPSISYQRAFPQIYNMITAVFTSPTAYYAGGTHYQFYTGQIPSFYLLSSYYQSIVYSSDTTTTSCYSMAPINPSPPVNMTTLTGITSLPSSIYGSSTVTFVDDTPACTTVDIIQSNKTSANSWCVQTPFTVNNVTQSNSTFILKSSTIVQSFPITPFSATLNCGTYATTWKYSGVNNSDGIALNSQISINSTTGSIKVQSMPVGNYSIKVIGTLPDLVTTFSANFTIIIKEANNPPYFTGEKPQNQKVMINTELFYPLPPFKDPEGSPVTISVEPDQAKTFVSVQDKTLKIAPKFSFQVRTTQITIILTNEEKSTSNSSFNVTVFSRPEFTKKLQKQDIAILSYTKYTLPVNIESKYYVINSVLPHFVDFEYPDYFFHPQKPNEIGNYIIIGELCDENAQTQFQLQVNVTNQAPYLLDGKISDLRVPIKSEYSLYFSQGVDREGQKIAYEANERNKQVLPSFINFNPGTRQFKIQPTKLDALKDYNIELSLIDEFGSRTMYPFVVTIYDPLKLFQYATNNRKNVLKQLPKNYLSAKIQSINPYGLIVIKFNETLKTPLLINNASQKYNSTNIDVRLKPFQDQNQQNLNKSIAQWQAINSTTTELTIQVNFSDPAQISSKISQIDNIEITFRDGELFKSTNGGKCLPDNYVLISGLPRQIVLTKQIASMSEMISGGSKAMTYLVIGNVALQLFMSFSMHLLWGMMNNLQLMGKMLKFNVNVPSNAYIFFKYIDEFLSMKANFIEDYLDKFNNYIMKTTGSSGESDKDANSTVIKNLGTTILVSVALVIAMISTAILIKYIRVPLIMKITIALKNKLFFNSILRTGVQSYMQISMIAFASLDSRKDNSTLAIGILFVCLTVSFLFFAHTFLRKNLSSLSEPNFQQRFNSLYLNIDTEIPHSYFLTTIFLLRRFILGIILSFCDDHQGVQFFYMNFITFLIIIYLVKVRPLVSNYLNAIEIFNEVILYGCTGLIWGMSDYQGDWPPGFTAEQIKVANNSKQNQIGWAYIILASTTIVTTIGGIIINFLILIRTKLIGKCKNNSKAVKEPITHTRSQDCALQKQDHSTMIQNNSVAPEINQKVQSHIEIQENPSQQIEEEIKLDDPDLNNYTNIPDSSAKRDSGFNNEEIKRQNQLKKSRLEALSRLNNKIRLQKQSILISSTEFNTNFEEMKDIFENIKVPPKPILPPKHKPLEKDVFVTREEIKSIYKESDQLPQSDQ